MSFTPMPHIIHMLGASTIVVKLADIMPTLTTMALDLYTMAQPLPT